MNRDSQHGWKQTQRNSLSQCISHLWSVRDDVVDWLVFDAFDCRPYQQNAEVSNKLTQFSAQVESTTNTMRHRCKRNWQNDWHPYQLTADAAAGGWAGLAIGGRQAPPRWAATYDQQQQPGWALRGLSAVLATARPGDTVKVPSLNYHCDCSALLPITRHMADSLLSWRYYLRLAIILTRL